jgi:hypothetical protein
MSCAADHFPAPPAIARIAVFTLSQATAKIGATCR